MRQFNQLRDLVQPVEGIRFDGDIVLGDDIEHLPRLLRAADERAMDADIAEDELGEGHGDIGWLQQQKASAHARSLREYNGRVIEKSSQQSQSKRDTHLRNLHHQPMHLRNRTRQPRRILRITNTNRRISPHPIRDSLNLLHDLLLPLPRINHHSSTTLPRQTQPLIPSINTHNLQPQRPPKLTSQMPQTPSSTHQRNRLPLLQPRPRQSSPDRNPRARQRRRCLEPHRVREAAALPAVDNHILSKSAVKRDAHMALHVRAIVLKSFGPETVAAVPAAMDG